MKIKLFALASLVATYYSAQTLEKTYNSHEPLSVVNLSNAGYKYMQVNGYNVKLYNTDHSLWKTINTTPPSGYQPAASVFYVSDLLFDSNPDVDLMVHYMKYINSPVMSYTSVVVFYDESGDFWSIDQCSQATVSKVGNDWKLIAAIDSTGKYYKRLRWEVYSLPGSLPTPTGLLKNEPGQGEVLSDPVPNPSTERVIIPYALPEGSTQGELTIFDAHGREVKRYTVDRTFNTIEINNTDLASGTYFYQLQVGQHSDTKKMIIIR